MSHFTVCLRITKSALDTAGGNIEAACKALLAPYQENNMGDCPDEYLEFHDTEDEHIRDYETGSSDMIRMPDGELVYPWDERLKQRGATVFETKTVVPPELERVTVPHKERYPTLEAFVADYCGYEERDDEKGRFGYWENPNKKWDWWAIGGRWSGHFPVKPGQSTKLGPPRRRLFGDEEPPKPNHADIVRLDQIDFDAVVSTMHERAEKFWAEWLRFLGGERFQAFDGPREMALRIGLLNVRHGAAEPSEESRCLSWAGLVQKGDPRANWNDVYELITREAFFAKYLEAFNPLATFATLDETGWKEPGEMGWFGCSSDTPETYLESKKGFAGWLCSAPPDAHLVVVDCHI